MKIFRTGKAMILIVLLFVWYACEGGKERMNLINVKPSIEIKGPAGIRRTGERIYLKAGSYLDLRVIFEPQENFIPTSVPLSVSFHLKSGGGETVMIEDHQPPIPSTEWRAGYPMKYRKIVHVDERVPYSKIIMMLGLYDPQKPGVEHYVLSKDDEAVKKAEAASIYVEKVESFQYKEGFYATEFDGGTKESWRWMGKQGRIMMKTPQHPGFVHIKGSTMLECFDRPPTLTWRVCGDSEGSKAFDNDKITADMFIMPECLKGEEIEIILETDAVFSPFECRGGSDDRRLGMMLSSASFSGVRYDEGWYGEESSDYKDWRWMGYEGRVTLAVPSEGGHLVIIGRAPIDKLGEHPMVRIELDGSVIDEFRAKKELLDKMYPLDPSLREKGAETAELILSTDRTFVPQESGIADDGRELGLYISGIDVIPGIN